jgi:hypothetical protein
MTLLLSIDKAYLCPGDENGAHVTDNPVCCGCGNSNLASLSRILDREKTVVSMLDILRENCSEVRITN